MFIECQNCSNRHIIQKSNKEFNLECSCGEVLNILPWLSYRQVIKSTGKTKCSLCDRIYDLAKYRKTTEIACNCGNLLVIDTPDKLKRNIGRRKTDHLSKQVQLKLRGLIDTCRLIYSVRNIDKLLLLVIGVAADMFEAEGSSVILTEAGSGDLVFNFVTGPKSVKLSSFRLKSGEGIVGNSILRKESLIVNNVEEDPRFSKRADNTSKFNTRSVLCLPLIIDENCIGAVEIVNKKGEKGFNEDDLFLGEAIVSQISIAINNLNLTNAAIKAERLAAIGTAVTGAAHCVKNMLNGLEGGLYVLKSDIEEKHNEIPDRGFEMLERNMGMLKGLVTDMLTYSKDRQPEYKAESVNDLVNSVVDLMKAKADQRNIKICFNPDSAIKETTIDSKGIYRCILNLVSNAVEASDKEGSVVKVNTESLNNGKILIEIADQGCGMNESDIQSVFKPFFSTKGSKGTGLGLSVTAKIIQEHKGNIEVRSEPGKGSTFSVYLPVR